MEENRIFGPTRGSIISVTNELGKLAIFIIGVIIAYFLMGRNIAESGNFAVLAIFIISPITRLIKFFSTTYEVNEKSFLVKSGLLTKNVLEIPLEVITTVDFGQSLFYQIFQCYKVKIDNGSQGGGKKQKAEILLSLTKKDALRLKEILEGKKLEKTKVSEEKKEVSHYINTKVMDTVLFGIFSSNLLNIIQVLVVFFPILSIGLYLFTGMEEDQIYDIAFQWIAEGRAVLIIWMIITVLITNLAYVIIMSLLRYYPFQARFNEKEIKVEYGTIAKKAYTFNRKKISGIKRKQSMWMRLFGYETLELLIIGYGDQSSDEKVKEVPLLIPIIKVSEAEHILGQLFRDYKEEHDIFNAGRKGLPYFFLAFRVFLGIAIICAAFVFTQLWYLRALAILLILIIILSVWMEYKATKILVGENYITVVTGSFQLIKKLIPWDKVEAVSGAGSIWKQKRGLLTILFQANAPLSESRLKVKNLDKRVLEAIVRKVPT